MDFSHNDFSGWNFAHQYLANAKFDYSTLDFADFSGADLRGASGVDYSQMYGANLIRHDGAVAGVYVDEYDYLLLIRNYDGDSARSLDPIAIHVTDHFYINGGTLQMVFESGPWNSQITFAPGIPNVLNGWLELTFAEDVDVGEQVGRTFDLFDWTGILPDGVFELVSPFIWDATALYTTGNITLLALDAIPGDANFDGVVDGADFTLWSDNYLSTNVSFAQGDFNGDGVTDGADFTLWADHYVPLNTPAMAFAVPEPNACLLALVGGLGAIGRVWLRRRGQGRGKS